MRSWMSGNRGPPPSSGPGLPGLPTLPGVGTGGSPTPPVRPPPRQRSEATQPLMAGGYSGYERPVAVERPVAGVQPAYERPSRGPVPPTPTPAPASEKAAFRIAESLTEAHARSNRVVVSPADFDDGTYVAVKGTYMFTTLADPKMSPGCIGLSRLQRQWAGLSTGAGVAVEEYGFPGAEAVLVGVDLQVSFWSERTGVATAFKSEDLGAVFSASNQQIILSVGEPVVFDFQGLNLKAVVTATHTVGGTGVPGILTGNTEVVMAKDPSSQIKVLSNTKKPPANAILAPNFKFEDMGIGGLDNEFATIFRRAFASRIIPRDLLERLGIQHVKGLLLYGPPGTGKTLMARQIGKMLNAREPKIVNGPEILSKFVGASEENIRNLFKDAEKEYKERGDESELHILILDELDAVCKQRGSTNNGTGVGDSVVNQLLSKMDGVDQLNNLLIIGMTNRKDMIDDALLRPGRLEVHVEISLPDEAGRVQILNVHTQNMRSSGAFGADVDLSEIAILTKNYSGAEISGLVKAAASYAYNRHIKIGSGVQVADDINNVKVTRDDFLRALDDLEPAFGVNEDELESTMPFGIIPYSSEIPEILHEGAILVKQAQQSRARVVSVLLHGDPGTGKSALASRIALDSAFPFIKRISPDSLIGLADVQKVAAIQKVFEDAYKSSFACVVVDGIEDLIEWAPIGPRFSNPVLQALRILVRKEPPKGRRILVLATSSNHDMLRDLDALDAFSQRIHIPAVNSPRRLDKVVRAVGLFPSDDAYPLLLRTLERNGLFSDALSIGVKRLLTIVEMARQDPSSTMEIFVSALRDAVQ